jgi:DNA-binding Xre family transcriptional regulator
MKLNLKNLLLERHIKQHHSYLVKNSLKHHTANKLLDAKIDRIQFKELLLLCRILLCTPNDLLVIEEKDKKLLAENHPLLQIKARQGKANLIDKLRKMLLEEQDEITELIEKKEAKG